MAERYSVIYRAALSERVSNDFADNYAFTRIGVEYGVRTQNGAVVWSKEVWQRGTWLPWRPFYDRRIRRAKDKAEAVWRALEGMTITPPVKQEGASASPCPGCEGGWGFADNAHTRDNRCQYDTQPKASEVP